MKRMSRRRFLKAAGVAAGATAASGIGYFAVSGRHRPPSVIFITADAMRADALGRRHSYTDMDGNAWAGSLTPTLDALCREGTTFTCAMAPSTWTAPSMMSVIYDEDPSTATYGAFERIAAQKEGLAQKFRDAGYVTIGVFANEVLEMEGIAKGFDACEFLRMDEESRRLTSWARVPACAERWAGRTNAAVARLLEAYRKDLRKKPLYLHVHYMDTHDPYNKYAFVLNCPWSDRLGIYNLNVAAHRGARTFVMDKQKGTEVSREDAVKYLTQYYNSGIHAVDRAVHELLGEVKRRGRLGKALVLFSSDHGEEFEDNNEFEEKRLGHIGRLSQAQLRIPLVVATRGARSYLSGGGTVSEPVSSRAVINGILRELLAGDDKDQIREAVEAGRFPEHPVVSAISFEGNRPKPLAKDPIAQRCAILRSGRQRYKVIRDHHAQRDLAYELDASGNAVRTEMSAELVRLAEAVIGGAGPSAPVISAEDRERLRALGYIGD